LAHRLPNVNFAHRRPTALPVRRWPCTISSRRFYLISVAEYSLVVLLVFAPL
jgi:hypothetical protein